MIDARECEAMALQCAEASAEATAESLAIKMEGGSPAKSDRWRRVAEALNDASEAFHRAANEIEAVSTER